MNDFHLEAELKSWNIEQKGSQINFFLYSTLIAIMSGVMINSLYYLLNYFPLDYYLFHWVVLLFSLGIIVYLCYQLKKFFKSLEFLMFNNHNLMKEYIHKKYRH